MSNEFNLKQTIDNFLKIKPPSKVKKIDFENKIIVGCLPLEATNVQPPDQSPCILEECESCHKKMWVSEKKRNHLDKKPNVEIYCFLCIFISATDQGVSIPDQIDIAKFQ